MAAEVTRLIAFGHADKADIADAVHAIARHAKLSDDNLITAEIGQAVLQPPYVGPGPALPAAAWPA